MLSKGAMKASLWLKAYEARNVGIGLAHGLGAGADRQGHVGRTRSDGADDDEKIGHLRAGANTAWVPSLTAATLHAIHYHREDVFEYRKAARCGEARHLPTTAGGRHQLVRR